MNKNKAVLLLGHGSKAPEANETLRKVAAAVKERGGYGYVLPAFLQMEQPDLQAAVEIMTSKGFTDIVVMPYFLYMGLHVTKDLPAEIEEAKGKHPGLKVTVTDCLGFHDKLIDITVERISGAGKGDKASAGPFAQHPIEKESFRILSEELDCGRFSALELPVVKRVVHTTADFEFQELLRFSPGAIEAGIGALTQGRNIVTDVKMIESGIARSRLAPFNSKVLCFSSDNDVASLAEKEGMTKTAASMRKAAPCMDGGIVVIGNAPTALFELLKLVREGAASPALIIGVPVGFVGAVESKEDLMKSGCAFICAAGRKGGSTVAVAITNALAILAGEGALK